jgi:hydroxymethylpyrimidine/phosphomethylpyrimidine kinase
VLTIASSDSGGGAGIQADLKAFARCGAHGMSAIVALTAQNTLGVTAIEELSPAFVRAQIDAVLDDIGADAAKTGMLFSAPLIEAVADALEPRYLPLVVDPVMVASSGSRLLLPDAVGTLVERLFPLATVVTPNLPEAQALTQLETEDRAVLAERLAAMGAPAVLVTGGHGAEPVDHLFDGSTHVAIPVARHRVAATHGAGCTHSAALAAGLAAGLSLTEAARLAADVAPEPAGGSAAALVGRKHAEFVAVGVGQDMPAQSALDCGLLGDQGCAEIYDPSDLCRQVGRAQIQVHPVLLPLVISCPLQQHLNSLAVLRHQGAVRTPRSRACSKSKRLRPEPRRALQIRAVDDDDQLAIPVSLRRPGHGLILSAGKRSWRWSRCRTRSRTTAWGSSGPIPGPAWRNQPSSWCWLVRSNGPSRSWARP